MRRCATETEELQERMSLSERADDILESCLRDRLSLQATMERFLPEMCDRFGAVAAAVLTRDEELNPAAYSWGDLGSDDAWTLLTNRADGVHTVAGRTLVCQKLDVAGAEVGTLGFLFQGELTDPENAKARVRCVCEELDAILSTIHTASEKQDLIERINRALSNRVFEQGLDDAVALLYGSVRFRLFLFTWRDVVRENALFYRLYRDGKVEFASERHPHPGLEAAIRQLGLEVLSPERRRLRAALGLDEGLERVITSGVTHADYLGKFLVQPAEGGFSTFALDLVRLLAEMARERLVDHNRERRHLSQFFPSSVISALLRQPSYESLLKPREEEVALLYADINGFTKISERVLEKPTLIGQFVDRWSEGAVEILWKHGGTFDKMVGDCIIGIFGPPFYDGPPAERALNALRAAREMLDFTVAFGEDPLLARLKEVPDVAKGLGIAVGINLCPACVGTFGPNHDITAFSSGMNATARLQALAGFRQILAMENVVEAVRSLPDAREFGFGPVEEAQVKNVLKPLRYSAVE